MTAAAKTPTLTQKQYLHATSTRGTPVRLVEFYVRVTKVSQSDWVVFNATNGFSGTFKAIKSVRVVDSSSDEAIETATFTNSNSRITLTGATAGTVHLWVIAQE